MSETQTIEELEATAQKARQDADLALKEAQKAREERLRQALEVSKNATSVLAEAERKAKEARAAADMAEDEAKKAAMGSEEEGPLDMRYYVCSKWPTLDIAIKSNPTKDRNGNVEGSGHHVRFSAGKFSSSIREEIEALESNELFLSGAIQRVDPVEEAKKEAIFQDITEKAKSLGYKLVRF